MVFRNEFILLFIIKLIDNFSMLKCRKPIAFGLEIEICWVKVFQLVDHLVRPSEYRRKNAQFEKLSFGLLVLKTQFKFYYLFSLEFFFDTFGIVFYVDV